MPRMRMVTLVAGGQEPDLYGIAVGDFFDVGAQPGCWASLVAMLLARSQAVFGAAGPADVAVVLVGGAGVGERLRGDENGQKSCSSSPHAPPHRTSAIGKSRIVSGFVVVGVCWPLVSCLTLSLRYRSSMLMDILPFPV